MDKFWNDLIFTICDGNAEGMAGLKKFDVMDFFDFVESKRKKDARK